MQKSVEKMSINYSPNFSLKKRSNSKLKYLIFHYTGMKSENKAIKRLTSSSSNVSCHYFIRSNGQIIKIVPDSYVAWHAGISEWKKDKLLNINSIGIEISNPGHEHGYKDFNFKQVNSIVKLTKFLKNKYKIRKENILGHSDIAPLRKIDPGEKFPWKLLHQKKLCLWHNINQKKCNSLRKIKLKDNRTFFNLLFKFGYKFSTNPADKIKIYKNFQRRFRPQLISGVVDKECFYILKSLI